MTMFPGGKVLAKAGGLGIAGYQLKRVRLLTLGLALASFLLNGCQSKTGKTEPAKPSPAPPARVLVRTSQKEDCAADGYLWLAAMWIDRAEKTAAANKALAENPNSTETKYQNAFGLSSDNYMKVTQEAAPEPEEGARKSASPTPSPAKPDQKDYDFLVTWETTYKENSKKSLNAPLQISVEENVWIEKLDGRSQPAVWQFRYVLDGGSDIDAYEKTAAEQNEKVVIPSRSSVIKEIREYILRPR